MAAETRTEERKEKKNAQKRENERQGAIWTESKREDQAGTGGEPTKRSERTDVNQRTGLSRTAAADGTRTKLARRLARPSGAFYASATAGTIRLADFPAVASAPAPARAPSIPPERRTSRTQALRPRLVHPRRTRSAPERGPAACTTYTPVPRGSVTRPAPPIAGSILALGPPSAQVRDSRTPVAARPAPTAACGTRPREAGLATDRQSSHADRC